MKNFLFFFVGILFFSCENEIITNNCFQGVSMNEVIYLSNPEFVDLQVPNGNVITTLGGRNIIVIRRNSNFKAFDLQCPESDCNDMMTFDGLKLICPCSKKEYNSLNGSPTDGKDCFVLEYNVVVNGNTLQITR